MANTGLRRGAYAIDPRLVYDRPAALSAFGPVRSIMNTFSFARNVGQGACAGLLTLLGSMHLAGAMPAEALAAGENRISAGLLDGFVETVFSAAGLPGVLEIIGAIALFLAAGRGAGRIIGLLAFIGFATAYANGVNAEEFADLLARVTDFIANAPAAFAASQ